MKSRLFFGGRKQNERKKSANETTTTCVTSPVGYCVRAVLWRVKSAGYPSRNNDAECEGTWSGTDWSTTRPQLRAFNYTRTQLYAVPRRVREKHHCKGWAKGRFGAALNAIAQSDWLDGCSISLCVPACMCVCVFACEV